MGLDTVFDNYVKESPFCVMARLLLERFLPAEEVDSLFEQHSVNQYTRELLFSTCVDLMALLVCSVHKSVKVGYSKLEDRFQVTLKCVYEKLQRVEKEVCIALVRHSRCRAEELLGELGERGAGLLPGYRLRIVDGNHLAATEKRLKGTRGHTAAPLPGQSLCVYDPDVDVIVDTIPCEDGHAQERSLHDELYPLMEAGDVWVADRNFCTSELLCKVAERQAYFVIRQHGSLTVVGQELYSSEVETATGYVSERAACVCVGGEVVLEVRQVRVRLKEPTQDGDSEIYVLTNLPLEVGAETISSLYLQRWSIESAFQTLTVSLRCEINTLCYPKAALFGFSMALVLYNVLSVLKAALAAEHGKKKIQEELSWYYMAEEIGGVYRGMVIALPATYWQGWQHKSVQEVAQVLRHIARQVKLRRYKKTPRQPKKKQARIVDAKPHVATARILQERNG